MNPITNITRPKIYAPVEVACTSCSAKPFKNCTIVSGTRNVTVTWYHLPREKLARTATMELASRNTKSIPVVTKTALIKEIPTVVLENVADLAEDLPLLMGSWITIGAGKGGRGKTYWQVVQVSARGLSVRTERGATKVLALPDNRISSVKHAEG